MSASQIDVQERVARACEALPRFVEETMARTGVPGVAFAVVHQGSIVVADGTGLRSLADASRGQIDADTVFQLASVSKPIAASVIAALVFRGELAWDAKIAEIMPGCELGDEYVNREVTVGDLLSHRSGLPHAAGDDLEDIGYQWRDILGRVAMLDPHPFRALHSYSNFGFTAAAQAVAQTSGIDWEALAVREIFAPLRMQTASYRSADFRAQHNRADLHARIAGRMEAAFERDPDQQAPAGGASASVRDLAQWMLLLLGGGSIDGVTLFDEAALAPALTPQVLTGLPADIKTVPRHYGYGFNITTSAAGRMFYGHSGGFLVGAGTTFRIIPELELGIAVLTNAAPIGAAESIAAMVQDFVEFGEVTRDWFGFYTVVVEQMNAPLGDLVGVTPPGATLADDISAYLGVYQDDYFGPAEVIQSSAGGVSVLLGPDLAYRIDLESWGDDVFAFVPHGENAPFGSLCSARFERDGGKVSQMRLDFFSDNGRGVWRR